MRGWLENLSPSLNRVKECNVMIKPSKKFRNILSKYTNSYRKVFGDYDLLVFEERLTEQNFVVLFT